MFKNVLDFLGRKTVDGFFQRILIGCLVMMIRSEALMVKIFRCFSVKQNQSSKFKTNMRKKLSNKLGRNLSAKHYLKKYNALSTQELS